jgi:hypothetical protein
MKTDRQDPPRVQNAWNRNDTKKERIKAAMEVALRGLFSIMHDACLLPIRSKSSGPGYAVSKSSELARSTDPFSPEAYSNAPILNQKWLI